MGVDASGEADRWVVATAFATVAAGAVGAATAWWAGREDSPAVVPPPGGRVVRQRGKASGRAKVTQVGGSRNVPSGGTGAGPGSVEQYADASDDAEVTQTGGDQNTTGPTA